MPCDDLTLLVLATATKDVAEAADWRRTSIIEGVEEMVRNAKARGADTDPAFVAALAKFEAAKGKPAAT